MIKYFFSLFILILFLVGCNNENRIKKLPDNIIPKDMMVEILVDIHLADGVLAVKKLDTKKHEYSIEGYYKFLYEKHGVSRNEIDSSIAFYSRYPTDYDKMYDEVLERISTIQTSIEKQDSIE